MKKEKTLILECNIEKWLLLCRLQSYNTRENVEKLSAMLILYLSGTVVRGLLLSGELLTDEGVLYRTSLHCVRQRTSFSCTTEGFLPPKQDARHSPWHEEMIAEWNWASCIARQSFHCQILHEINGVERIAGESLTMRRQKDISDHLPQGLGRRADRQIWLTGLPGKVSDESGGKYTSLL